MALIADKYEVLSELGSGGFSRVFECRQSTTDKIVAVKVLQKTLSASDLKRFQNEARILSSISHPNVVQVLEFGLTAEKQPYISMEKLEGISLEQRLSNGGPLLPAEFLEIFSQLLQALQCLHDSGIVHRDLKPANVMLSVNKDFTHTTLFDLGIAKRIGSEQQLTATGALLGTPAYMSPEQCTGDKIDERSDLYSLGCIMYECATGKPPFEGTAIEVMLAHSQKERPNIPKSLSPVLNRLLAVNVDERFGTCADVLSELRQLNLESVVNFKNEPRKLTLRSTRAIGFFCLAATIATGVFYVAGSVNHSSISRSTLESTPKRLNEELHNAYVEKNLSKQKVLLSELSSQDDLFWHLPQVTEDLTSIGKEQLQAHDREAADKAIEYALRSMRKKGESKEQFAKYLNQKVEEYHRAKIFDGNAEKYAWKALKIAEQTNNHSGQKWSTFQIAETYRGQGERVSAIEWYRKALKINNTDATLSLRIALNLCRCLEEENGSYYAERLRLLDFAATKLTKAASNPANLSEVENLALLPKSAKKIPSNLRKKALNTNVTRALITASKALSQPNLQTNLLIIAGDFQAEYDKAAAKATLHRAMNKASSNNLWHLYASSILALDDRGLLTSAQRIPLLTEAYNKNCKIEQSQGTLMNLSYRVGKAYVDRGQFEQGLDYYKLAASYACKYSSDDGFDGGIESKGTILFQVAQLAIAQGQSDLATVSVKEFKRILPDLPASFDAKCKKCKLDLEVIRQNLTIQ